jgi:hypothetical protein
MLGISLVSPCTGASWLIANPIIEILNEQQGIKWLALKHLTAARWGFCSGSNRNLIIPLYPLARVILREKRLIYHEHGFGHMVCFC